MTEQEIENIIDTIDNILAHESRYIKEKRVASGDYKAEACVKIGRQREKSVP